MVFATPTQFVFEAGPSYEQGVYSLGVAPDGDLLIGTLTQMYEWPAASPTISENPAMVLDGFDGLYGIAVHPDGRVFLSDTGKGVIWVAKEEAEEDTWSKEVLVGRQATFAVGERNAFDGVGTAATFDQPDGLALDAQRGMLYVADSSANLVRVVYLDTKTVVTLVGDVSTARRHNDSPPGGPNGPPGPNAGFTDGVGLAVRFQGPSGLALDALGNAFLIDQLGTPLAPQAGGPTGGGVRLVSGQQVFTVAGSPSHGNVNGAGSAARFNSPTYITTLPVASNGMAAGTQVIVDGFPTRKLRTMVCTGMPTPSFPPPPAPPAPPAANPTIATPVATILLSTGGGFIALIAIVGTLVAWKTGALCFAAKGTGAPQATLLTPVRPIEVVAWGEGANVSPNPARVASLNAAS